MTKHSSLFGAFVNYVENEVLLIRSQIPNAQKIDRLHSNLVCFSQPVKVNDTKKHTSLLRNLLIYPYIMN